MFHEHFHLIRETGADVDISDNWEAFIFFLLLLYVVGQEDIKSTDKNIRSDGEMCSMTWRCLQIQYQCHIWQ